MFERKFTRRLVPVVIGGVFLAAAMRVADSVQGQETPKKSAGVNVAFLPPPLEGATYSVGIYEAKSGKLVRRLCEAAPQSAFTVGLNGLVTSWDGKDDNGKTVPPGRYAARGYAVGPMTVEGTNILGNDWAADDENLRVRRVEAIAVIPEDDGLAAVVLTASAQWELLRFKRTDGTLLWRKPLPSKAAARISERGEHPEVTLEARGDALVVGVMREPSGYRIADGEPCPLPHGSSGVDDKILGKSSAGKDDTTWKIEKAVLVQWSAQGEVLRSLSAQKGNDLALHAVAASTKNDCLYVLEHNAFRERVRGLSWVETKQEDGKQISNWETFFERNIGALDPSFGLEEAALANPSSPTVEITLADNPLSPGKPERAKLTATFDEKGSYLATGDGVRLRQVSQRAHLRAVKLVKDKAASALTFYQSDGAAWDEFSIKGAKEIAGFDAGEFEITGAGVEKTNDAKAPEPDL